MGVKKVAKKLASKVTAKKPTKKVVAKKPAAKKAPAKKAVAKKAPAKKAPAKTAPAKKAVAKKAPAGRNPNIVKPQLSKKAPGKPFPAKLQSTTKGNATTISVAPKEVNVAEVVVVEKRLSMLPPTKPLNLSKKGPSLKPIKAAPAPHIASETDGAFTAAELKEMKQMLQKDLIRLREELAETEAEMEDLISAAGVGAGDDQADAGTKTFEREHEMSLVYNAQDMVLQTERAIERIENKSYGKCEECGSFIGKARLQVFPRATLCMSCKQKEERR